MTTTMLRAGFFSKVENELNDRNNDEAVGRRQNMELRRLLARRAERSFNVVFPVILKHPECSLGSTCKAITSGESRGKFNSLAGNVAPAVDRNHRDRRLAETCRVDGNLQLVSISRVVVAADHGEENNRQRNEEQRNPSPSKISRPARPR